MSSSNEVVIFGCKSTTKILINHIKSFMVIKAVITVDKEIASKNDIADYCDLTQFCESNGISIYKVTQYNLKSSEDYELLKELKPRIGFAMGWQRLIPAAILQLFEVGVFGMHGSSLDLPKGRGRSPMNWSILEGRKVFYTNLFKYDPGVDSGEVLGSFKFQITDQDSAETMHYKNCLAMGYLVKKHRRDIINNELMLQRQSEDSEPSYYPKRTPADSLINWNLDVYQLDRFVRAVAPPFNGAFSFINGNRVIIQRAQVFDLNDFGFDEASIGEVVCVFPNHKFVVKCFGGLLLVHKCTSEIAIEMNLVFDNGALDVTRKKFTLNTEGGYHLPE